MHPGLARQFVDGFLFADGFKGYVRLEVALKWRRCRVIACSLLAMLLQLAPLIPVAPFLGVLYNMAIDALFSITASLCCTTR